MANQIRKSTIVKNHKLEEAHRDRIEANLAEYAAKQLAIKGERLPSRARRGISTGLKNEKTLPAYRKNRSTRSGNSFGCGYASLLGSNNLSSS